MDGCSCRARSLLMVSVLLRFFFFLQSSLEFSIESVFVNGP